MSNPLAQVHLRLHWGSQRHHIALEEAPALGNEVGVLPMETIEMLRDRQHKNDFRAFKRGIHRLAPQLQGRQISQRSLIQRGDSDHLCNSHEMSGG